MDNTLFVLISDNGASAECGPVGSLNEMMFFNNAPESLQENVASIDELGGVNVFNHHARGWTNAGSTPFRRWKRETYRGGCTDRASSPGPRASGLAASCGCSTPISSTSCRPCWTRWAWKRRRASAASPRRPSKA
jgi:hypothetical protein